MSKFDAKTLSDLHEAHEVAIRTEKHPDSCRGDLGGGGRRRSLRPIVPGAKGRWYRDLAAGGPAVLEFGGRRLAVQAVPANDEAAIARASREYLRKYRSSSYAQAMVKPDILSTTLRLEPR